MVRPLQSNNKIPVLRILAALSRAQAQAAQPLQHFADLGGFKLVNGQSLHACMLGIPHLWAAQRSKIERHSPLGCNL
jgi:hypothetical protein